MAWLAIAVGGALGAMARHGVNHLVQSRWIAMRFPVGTAIVNLTGCFVIGLLAGLISAERIALPLFWRELVFVGLLGGFTTFSTFGLDTFVLGRSHSASLASINVAVHVLGGLAAVWLGYQLGSRS